MPPQTHLNLSGCGPRGPQKGAWEWLMRAGGANRRGGTSDKRVCTSQAWESAWEGGDGKEGLGEVSGSITEAAIMAFGYFVPWCLPDVLTTLLQPDFRPSPPPPWSDNTLLVVLPASRRGPQPSWQHPQLPILLSRT